VDDWPDADRTLFETAFMDGDVFDRGPLAHLAPASRAKIAWGYGAWLGWIAEARPALLAIPPPIRADRTTLVAYARHLAALGQSSRSLESCLKAIAHLLGAAGDLTIGERVRGLWRIGAVRSERATDIVSSDRLVAIGIGLMEAAMATAPLDRRRAADYRDGLIIALLAAVPLRRSNFAALEIGRRLIVEPDRILVSVEPEYTKSRKPIDMQVPRVVAPWLRRYIDHVRPLLAGSATSAFLWPSARGPHLTADRIYNIVVRMTARQLGQPLSPHAFRDAAATTIALYAPEKIVVARDLLGHADQKTTDKHYVRARGVETSRQVEQLITSFRGRH
jgi:integrase